MAVDLTTCESFPKRLTLLRKRPRQSSLLAIDSSTQNASKRPRPRTLMSLAEVRTGVSMTIRTPRIILMKAVSPPPKSLRKEAILNRLRLQGWTIPVSPLSLDESNRTSKSLLKIEEPDEMFPKEKPISRPSLTPTPSPLGISNYDALDDWKGYDDEFDDQIEMDDDDDQVYSDFNFLDSDSSDSTNQYDDPFSVLPTELTPPTTPTEFQPSILRSSKTTKCSPNWCSSPISCQVCG